LSPVPGVRPGCHRDTPQGPALQEARVRGADLGDAPISVSALPISVQAVRTPQRPLPGQPPHGHHGVLHQKRKEGDEVFTLSTTLLLYKGNASAGTVVIATAQGTEDPGANPPAEV
jgi:hypothetical protein